MTQVIHDVLSRQKGVTLVSLQSLAPYALIDGGPAQDAAQPPGAEATPGQTVPATAVNSGSEGPYVHSVKLVVQGRYLDVLAYLQALEGLPWHFYWQSLVLDATHSPTDPGDRDARNREHEPRVDRVMSRRIAIITLAVLLACTLTGIGRTGNLADPTQPPRAGSLVRDASGLRVAGVLCHGGVFVGIADDRLVHAGDSVDGNLIRSISAAGIRYSRGKHDRFAYAPQPQLAGCTGTATASLRRRAALRSGRGRCARRRLPGSAC